MFQFSEKMELAQNRFSQIGLANDVDTARHFLQQHQELKKSTSLFELLGSPPYFVNIWTKHK